MNQDFPPELQSAFTNDLLQSFAIQLDKALRERLRAISPKVPSQTIQALTYRILKAKAGDISAKFEMSFQDSGRISEMKQIEYKGLRPIDALEEWVKKNRASFTRIPGYKDQAPGLTEQQKVRRIASAIAFSQAKVVIRRGRDKKERTWLNPTFYGFFNRLVGDFITEQAEYFQNVIRSSIDGAQEITG